jgi:hypothetical protein
MTQIVLDDEPDAVRQFFERLPNDRSETVLSLQGKRFFWVVRETTSDLSLPTDGEWSDQMNQRRFELIDKEIDGTMTELEKTELDDLQSRMRRYVEKVAPLPMESARQFYTNLLAKAAQAHTNSAP